MKKISSLEYNILIWFIIKACFTELTITTILTHSKQDTYIATIIGSIIGLIPFTIYEILKNKYPNENYLTLNKKLFKRGCLLNIIMFLGSLIALICTFWILVHFTNSLFLYKTSSWIISLTLIIPIMYASIKGINVISKVSLILFYISIFIIFIIMTGTFSEIDINNVKPILNTNITNITHSSLIFIAFNILKVFFLTLIPKNKINKYSSKMSYLTYFIVCIYMIDLTISTISIFGIDLSTIYEFPAFQILKRVNILGIIDRVESILSVEGIFAVFIEMTIITCFAKETIKETLKTKEKTDKYIIILICLITLITSNIIFKNQELGEKFFTGPLLYIIYIVCLLIPSITLIKSFKQTKLINQKDN